MTMNHHEPAIRGLFYGPVHRDERWRGGLAYSLVPDELYADQHAYEDHLQMQEELEREGDDNGCPSLGVSEWHPCLAKSSDRFRWNGDIGFHNENGPAYINERGAEWYRNNLRHRMRGPATMWFDGREYWYRDGEDITTIVEDFSNTEGRWSTWDEAAWTRLDVLLALH